MNLVVTGATSFLGAPMAEYCLKQGHQVFAVVRPGSKNMAQIEALKKRYGSQIQVVPMKLDELEDIGDTVTVPCQVWIHFGWDGAGSGNRTQQDIQQKNVGDSLCALKGADSLGCSRFLFSGSQAEYGIRDSLMKETDCCHPVSEYGKAKVEFYRQAVSYMRERQNSHPMEYVHARIFSVYGPGDHPWSLAETCKKTFLSGGHMELGECTQQWNFLHRDDCIRALYLLATAPESIGFSEKSMEESNIYGESGAYKENGIYNVAGLEEETRPLRKYGEEMYRLCGQNGTCQYGKRPPNAEGQANLIPSTRKLRNLTGFVPKIDFQRGFQDLIDWR